MSAAPSTNNTPPKTNRAASCLGNDRKQALQKLLSVTSRTSHEEKVQSGYQVKEKLDDVAARPDEFSLIIEDVGRYTGTTDAAEYIMLSWHEYNGGLFGFDSRDITGLRCLSENHVMMTTADIITSKGMSSSEMSGSYIHFLPDTALILNWTAMLPNIGLEDHYFDPRLLCDTAILRCPADLYPYNSLQDCYDIVSTLPQACQTENGYQKDKGMNGFLQGDTVACRYLHLTSSALRPKIHCAHMSSNSSKCAAEKCPSAVRSDEVSDLTPSFDATTPEWLTWIESVAFGFFFLQTFVTYAWYRYVRTRISLQKHSNAQQNDENKKENSENAKDSYSDRYLTDHESRTTGTRDPPMLPSLQAKDLHFSWTNSDLGTILKTENFLLGGCKMTAIRAPSGSGKSTFLKLLAGFRQDHMTLTIGKYVSRPPLIMCQQSADLWPAEILVKDVLLFSSILFGSNLDNYTHCFDMLGLTQLYDQQFSTLSGGQQQLVNIASTIVCPKPTMILLDEALASLDEEKASELVRLLKELPIEHAFVLTVHMCSSTVLLDFNKIITFDMYQDDGSASNNEVEETGQDRNASRNMQMRQGLFEGRESCCALNGNGIDLMHQGILAMFIAWHAQFFSWPIVEMIISFASLCGGVLVGVFARGSLVDDNGMDYIPTKDSIRVPFYMTAALVGILMITSLGVPLVYGVRESKMALNFIEQRALSPAAYLVVTLLRCFFFGCLQSICWICTMLPMIDLVSGNFVMILLNTAIFGGTWACVCSCVVITLPKAYSAHGVMIANVFSILFSGTLFDWDSIYGVLRIIHYINPLFYFASCCSYLLLEDLDTRCGDGGLLHPGECASSMRAFEMSTIQEITSLQALAIAFIYVLASSLGMWYVLRPTGNAASFYPSTGICSGTPMCSFGTLSQRFFSWIGRI